MISQFKTNLQNLISEGNFNAVFEQLRRGLDERSSYSPLVLTRLCHFQMAKKRYLGGMLSESEFQTEQTRIAHALLALIDDLSADDLQPFCADALEEALQALVLGTMGRLQLFNCNRQEPFRAFVDFFQQERNLPCQFYFIAGTPHQKPGSFAERIIYEIIEDRKLQEDDAVVEYEREAVWLGGTRTERVKFHPLPLGLNAESSQVKFKKYFSDRMAPFQEKAALDTFFDMSEKFLRFKYVALVFKVESEQWDAELRKYIQWIVDFFRQHPGGQIQFLVFIVLHTPPQALFPSNAALSGIQDIVRQTPDTCLLLEDLKPVGRENVSAWFRSVSSIPDPLKIEAVIDAYAKNITQKQSGFRIEFDMMELEPLFERVYLQHLKK